MGKAKVNQNELAAKAVKSKGLSIRVDKREIIRLFGIGNLVSGILVTVARPAASNKKRRYCDRESGRYES